MDRDPVGKALTVLLALGDRPAAPWSVRQFARELDTSPATIHRIFSTFESRDLLARDEDGGYRPGPGLFRLCRAVQDNLSPVGSAHEHLEALARESGEAALFGAYEPGRHEMMFVDVVQSTHPLHYDVGVYRWIPVHAGATGLAILAFLPEVERREVYRRGLPSLTEATLTSEAAIERECARIRERGYAVSSGQRLGGAVGIAAPVFEGPDRVLGDIAVTVPDQRFEASWEEPLSRAVVTTARHVSEELQGGHRRD
jgi:DNA-binding IclR family transcriptional regulator